MTLRLATYNVEWMNALFDDADQMLDDDAPSARYQISRARQLAALGTVIAALDADGLIIIEAPDQSAKRSTTRALEGFAAHFHLRARKAMVGKASATEQEIAFLYDPDVLTVSPEMPAPPPLARVAFSKPPLELRIAGRGRTLHLAGVHAKSKTPHGKVSTAAFTRISVENRRKQLAECHWLRARAEQHLAQGSSVVMMGDFNDGPGLDKYERLFGKSGVEVVLGLDQPRPLRLYDPHAYLALNQRAGLQPTSARFWLAPQQRYFEALLDYIMVSADLFAQKPAWRIWHPFNDPGCVGVPGLSTALLSASDHFPVTIDLP